MSPSSEPDSTLDPIVDPIIETDEMTLNEAADLLGVHYMTAYRYVRVGKLAAHKEGRDWRIRRTDLDLMLAPQPDAIEADAGRRRADWADRVYRRATAYDERGAWQAVEAAMAAGATPVDLYHTVIIPVLARLGQGWADGELTIAEEHAATNVCRKLVGRLGLLATRRGRPKGTIALACAPGERHGLATAVAADIFRASGYAVIDCGAEFPLASFIDLVADTAAITAVGISTTMPSNRAAVIETIAEVRRRAPHVTVMVGGAGVDGVEAHELGADVVARTAIDGVGRLEEPEP